MSTIAVYNGVRLWKNAKTLRAVPAASGAVAKQGQSKKRGRVNNRSPNHLWEIMVATSIPPVTQINVNYGRQATHHLYMLQVGAQLIEQSRSFGHLAWIVDDTVQQDVVSVTGSGASTDVTLNSFATWTPTVGELVCLRNPVTGEGFCSAISVVGSGPPYTIRVNANRMGLDRVDEDVSGDITSAWIAYRCAYYFPDCQFVRPNWQEVPSQGEDKHSSAAFQIRSESDAIYATAALLDLE